ncbi:hypothetical protein BLNAU_1235 [Blattamonas nauphoetae]|uniref:Uncharacterized protein n=1 Tax=Blattamonas nauphoetae TaxID=2049346 RepID=A0ABQ9YIU0_9EUKA|nr:hypothetical protein BLNAU_1235 [Blattamonas nauphoetae]
MGHFNDVTASTASIYSAFLDWLPTDFDSLKEASPAFQSLVLMFRDEYSIDDTIVLKVTMFLQSITPGTTESFDCDEFFTELIPSPSNPVESLLDALYILLSSNHQPIIQSTLKVLSRLILFSSSPYQLNLIQANVVNQLLLILQPCSLEFSEHILIHADFIRILTYASQTSTPSRIRQLKTNYAVTNENVPEIVLNHVLLPAKDYLVHLISHRFSLMDTVQSELLPVLISLLLFVSPYHLPTFDYTFSLSLPLVHQCVLDLVQYDGVFFKLWFDISFNIPKWKEKRAEIKINGQIMIRSLVSEGLDDKTEQSLIHDIYGSYDDEIVPQIARHLCFFGGNVTTSWH